MLLLSVMYMLSLLVTLIWIEGSEQHQSTTLPLAAFQLLG